MTVQRIRFSKSGDRLTSRHYNQVIEGANLALEVLGPPRSKRLPASDPQEITLDENGDGDLNEITTVVYTEYMRSTSTLRIFQEGNSDVYVDVERIDEICLRSETENIKLIFDNP